jgi:DNA mismatch repair protein MutS
MSVKNIKDIVSHHRAIKEQHPTAIVLLELDNFYKAFDDDAHLLHEILDISLRNTDAKYVVPAEAGFPIAALDTNLAKLLNAGYMVAICS